MYAEAGSNNHCLLDDVTLQFPILQDKNLENDTLAMVFHAQGFLTQLSQVAGLYWSPLIP
jgi:hypothetical protein